MSPPSRERSTTSDLQNIPIVIDTYNLIVFKSNVYLWQYTYVSILSKYQYQREIVSMVTSSVQYYHKYRNYCNIHCSIFITSLNTSPYEFDINIVIISIIVIINYSHDTYIVTWNFWHRPTLISNSWNIT